MNKFGYVGIEPRGTLAETAALLGRALDELPFRADAEFRYDEYPAYVAERDGLRYALLGVPAPENDLRDVPTNDFQLMIKPILFDLESGKIDISNELKKKIDESGLLKCRLLE
ncbi:hypothetical protein [Burkholderia ambifaria]|uniref:Uncharacterized protein n=1 Tax=Burkholderia ambifaria MEX-5 TaxID=396597 RepID=B1TGI1_9BURK|nr:hypothetical protein [Burkholderia ambifaria]EDT37324.1 hypothetical protein BamMEX5DRAFT_6897 [Burkholderia ambifaria MEX-5]